MLHFFHCPCYYALLLHMLNISYCDFYCALWVLILFTDTVRFYFNFIVYRELIFWVALNNVKCLEKACRAYSRIRNTKHQVLQVYCAVLKLCNDTLLNSNMLMVDLKQWMARDSGISSGDSAIGSEGLDGWGDVALLLQPLQARVVGVQLEGFVEEIGQQRLERVHHCQKLQQVRRVRTFWKGQFARLKCDNCPKPFPHSLPGNWLVSSSTPVSGRKGSQRETRTIRSACRVCWTSRIIVNRNVLCTTWYLCNFNHIPNWTSTQDSIRFIVRSSIQFYWFIEWFFVYQFVMKELSSRLDASICWWGCSEQASCNTTQEDLERLALIEFII